MDVAVKAVSAVEDAVIQLRVVESVLLVKKEGTAAPIVEEIAGDVDEIDLVDEGGSTEVDGYLIQGESISIDLEQVTIDELTSIAFRAEVTVM